ncbi:MAG: 50S ribosomal protein L23 [Candidatus Woesearchaeota archaeon]
METIIHPLSTEKSIRLMESKNVLVFIVKKDATKQTIKKDIEENFNVKVDKIRTTIMPDGRKKAYVTINKANPAIDIATKLGMI